MAIKKKISWLNRIMLVFNILALLPLFACYLAPFINPGSFWLFAFLGLTYPFWLVLHTLFIVFWIFRFHRYVFISLISILLGYSHLANNIQLFSFSESNADSTGIKVMSYNVRNFDLYNYTPDWKIRQENRLKIMSFVQAEQPDIVCFQEFVHIDGNSFPTLDTLKQLLNHPKCHVNYSRSNRDCHFGLATFSKYRIVNRGYIKFKNAEGNNMCIYSDMIIDGDTVRVYNMHLQSIHLENPDYEFARDIKEGTLEDDTESFRMKARKIASALKRAFKKRADQALKIRQHINDCPYKVIVCGDFNDTPSSFTYHQIADNLFDAFPYCGSGIGETYNGLFPLLRIDYIFFSEGMNATDYKKHKVDYSDHHPISCRIKLQKEANR